MDDCINSLPRRGLSIFSVSEFLKIFFPQISEILLLVQVYYIHVSEWNGFYSVTLWPVSWLPNSFFGDFWAFLAMRDLEFSKFSKMNIQTVNSFWWRVKWAPEIVHPIISWKKVTLVCTLFKIFWPKRAFLRPKRALCWPGCLFCR